jgi:hypothetical protein
MKNTKLGLILLVMVFLAACSTTQIDPTKPEMSVQDRSTLPPRTFNQFHKDWDY